MGELGAVESKYGYRCESEPVLSSNVVHAALKTVALFLYMYSIGKLHEQNILNLE
jgi:hypothetical protein